MRATTHVIDYKLVARHSQPRTIYRLSDFGTAGVRQRNLDSANGASRSSRQVLAKAVKSLVSSLNGSIRLDHLLTSFGGGE
jgi:hypothetical protein